MIGPSRGLPRMFAFLFELAWASRVRIPLLIAVAFMLTNVHMRLEININFAMEEQIVVQEEAIENDSEDDENEHDDDSLVDQLLSQAELELEETGSENGDLLSEDENGSEKFDEERDLSRNEHIHSAIVKSNVSKPTGLHLGECAHIQSTLKPSPRPETSMKVLPSISEPLDR